MALPTETVKSELLVPPAFKFTWEGLNEKVGALGPEGLEAAERLMVPENPEVTLVRVIVDVPMEPTLLGPMEREPGSAVMEKPLAAATV